MKCFEILGIEPTDELKKIKKAYAAKSRECHPEEHPEEFQILHDAYEEAQAFAKRNKGQGRPEQDMETVPLQPEDTGPSLKTEKVQNQAEQYEEQKGSEWDADFRNIAFAGEQNQGLSAAVRRVMEQCSALYMREDERGKLYRWKDIFEEPDLASLFQTGEFIKAWYQFLQTHSIFPIQLWQYFASLDGCRFFPEAHGMQRFPYQFYIERMQTMNQPGQQANRQYNTQPNMQNPQSQTWTYQNQPVMNQGQGSQKKEHSALIRGIVYVAAAIGTGIMGAVLGMILGLIFG